EAHQVGGCGSRDDGDVGLAGRTGHGGRREGGTPRRARRESDRQLRRPRRRAGRQPRRPLRRRHRRRGGLLRRPLPLLLRRRRLRGGIGRGLQCRCRSRL
ncbi:MAG: hypothetical protein AVDCRST_MAG78-2681, partial [uncultured Rubrobacteraceae bacterium]